MCAVWLICFKFSLLSYVITFPHLHISKWYSVSNFWH